MTVVGRSLALSILALTTIILAGCAAPVLLGLPATPDGIVKTVSRGDLSVDRSFGRYTYVVFEKGEDQRNIAFMNDLSRVVGTGTIGNHKEMDEFVIPWLGNNYDFELGDDILRTACPTSVEAPAPAVCPPRTRSHGPYLVTVGKPIIVGVAPSHPLLIANLSPYEEGALDACVAAFFNAQRRPVSEDEAFNDRYADMKSALIQLNSAISLDSVIALFKN